MLTNRLAAFTAALLALSVQHPAAQEAAGDPAGLVVVEGLAIDDMLNVRATASATGMVIGRVSNGSTLRNYGCDEVNGYKWCKIAAVDDEKLHGWTPGRYLQALAGDAAAKSVPEGAEAATGETGEQPTPRDEAAGPAATLPAPSPIAVPSEKPVIAAEAPPAEAGSAAKAPSAPQAAQDVPVPLGSGGPAQAVPTDLAARWGVAPQPEAGPDEKAASPAVTESDAIASAFQMAFAATDAPATGELYTLGLEDKPAPSAAAEPAPPAKVEKAAPAPRPAAPERRTTDPRVAQLQAGPTAPAFDMVGEVPCARYIGQPMTRCEAAVARSGADAAEVTVTLPDGGKRVIRFRQGKPEGSNSRGEFRFTREGDLSMIRVGTSERFEIPDSLAFGD